MSPVNMVLLSIIWAAAHTGLDNYQRHFEVCLKHMTHLLLQNILRINKYCCHYCYSICCKCRQGGLIAATLEPVHHETHVQYNNLGLDKYTSITVHATYVRSMMLELYWEYGTTALAIIEAPTV